MSNYKPITCLPLMRKLLTGIVADGIYNHLKENDLLPKEQKVCRRNSRGTNDSYEKLFEMESGVKHGLDRLLKGL